MRFLLIPGAGGAGAWFWHRVVPLLVAAGHEAVAVDLPGDDASAGLPEYVELAVAAAQRFTGDGPLVVVGQSLGGFSAPQVAERLDARLLVFLNAMVPIPGETAGAWWEATGQRKGMHENDVREGREPGGFDPGTYFLHDLPPDVLAGAAAGDRPQTDTVFAAPFPDHLPDIPMLAVGSREDRFFPVGFQRELVRDRLGLELVEIPGGHLAAVSRPEEFVTAVLARL